MDKFEWPDREQMEKDANDEGGLCEVLWRVRLHVEALEAERDTLRKLLGDAYSALRIQASPVLLKRIKAALAAGEGE